MPSTRTPASAPPASTAAPDRSRALARHIGGVVRRLRLAQHLTIAEIARKARISSGMLSKIENGQSSTSLDTLLNLAGALGVTLGSVVQGFSVEEGGAQLVRKGQGLEVVRRGTRKGHTYHLLAVDRGPRRVFEPFLVTLTDKSEVFPGFEHPGIELIHILQGRLTYRHGRHSYALGPGDTLSFRGEIAHGPEKLIKLPIRMLSIIIYDESAAATRMAAG